MRFFYRLGIAPTPKNPLSIVRAQGEEDSTTRWLGGSLDLKTLLAGAGLLITVVGFRVTTQTSLAEGRAEREAEKAARIEAVEALSARVTRLERNTVGRDEIKQGFDHVAERQSFTQQQVQQLYTLQLRPPR